MTKPSRASMMLVAFLGLMGPSARGDVITTLFSTGAGLGTGVDDLHWTVVGPAGATITNGSGGAAITIPPVSGAYVAPPSGTQWIGLTANNLQDEPAGSYTFSTTFNIGAGETASTATITGNVSADNQITDIILNGHSLGISLGDPVLSFQSLHPISIGGGAVAADFNVGANTLQFVVSNPAASPPNPTAFVAALSGTVSPAAVPEPSIVILGGLGGILVVGYRRVRKYCRRA